MQRLLPPGPGNPATIQIADRSYSCALGSFIDVPDADAMVMRANGWIPSASNGTVGTTAGRPLSPPSGTGYFDTTLGKGIVFDGLLWVDPDTGAAV